MNHIVLQGYETECTLPRKLSLDYPDKRDSAKFNDIHMKVFSVAD